MYFDAIVSSVVGWILVFASHCTDYSLPLRSLFFNDPTRTTNNSQLKIVRSADTLQKKILDATDKTPVILSPSLPSPILQTCATDTQERHSQKSRARYTVSIPDHFRQVHSSRCTSSTEKMQFRRVWKPGSKYEYSLHFCIWKWQFMSSNMKMTIMVLGLNRKHLLKVTANRNWTNFLGKP